MLSELVTSITPANWFLINIFHREYASSVKAPPDLISAVDIKDCVAGAAISLSVGGRSYLWLFIRRDFHHCQRPANKSGSPLTSAGIIYAAGLPFLRRSSSSPIIGGFFECGSDSAWLNIKSRLLLKVRDPHTSAHKPARILRPM